MREICPCCKKVVNFKIDWDDIKNLWTYCPLCYQAIGWIKEDGTHRIVEDK